MNTTSATVTTSVKTVTNTNLATITMAPDTNNNLCEKC